MTVSLELLAGLLFAALLAGSVAALALRGRRGLAAGLAAGLAGGGVWLWLALPGASAAAALLAAGFAALGPAAGSSRSGARLGKLGRSGWVGGSSVVASERW